MMKWCDQKYQTFEDKLFYSVVAIINKNATQ